MLFKIICCFVVLLLCIFELFVIASLVGTFGAWQVILLACPYWLPFVIMRRQTGDLRTDRTCTRTHTNDHAEGKFQDPNVGGKGLNLGCCRAWGQGPCKGQIQDPILGARARSWRQGPCKGKFRIRSWARNEVARPRAPACRCVHWLEDGTADTSVPMGELNLLDDMGHEHGVQSRFAVG